MFSKHGRVRALLMVITVVVLVTFVLLNSLTSPGHESIEGQNTNVEFIVSIEEDAKVHRNPSSLSQNMFPVLNQTKVLQQAKLLKNINSACGGLKSFSSLNKWQQRWVLRHLIVDDKYRLLYCYIPKVGCANWKRVFSVLYGDASDPNTITNVNHTSMKLLDSYSPHEIKYRLRTYFKFMFVRHPLDRLLSAYRNKFGEHFRDFERKFGVYIVKHFRQNPPKNPTGDDVTFTEFLDYVSQTDKVQLNEHWSRYVDLCQPCHIDYDFIGYYEQFDEDIHFLLNALLLNAVVQFPAKQSYYSTLTEEEKVRIIKKVPNSTLRKLEERFKKDYRFFGYGREPFGFPQI